MIQFPIYRKDETQTATLSCSIRRLTSRSFCHDVAPCLPSGEFMACVPPAPGFSTGIPQGDRWVQQPRNHLGHPQPSPESLVQVLAPLPTSAPAAAHPGEQQLTTQIFYFLLPRGRCWFSLAHVESKPDERQFLVALLLSNTMKIM